LKHLYKKHQEEMNTV